MLQHEYSNSIISVCGITERFFVCISIAGSLSSIKKMATFPGLPPPKSVPIAQPATTVKVVKPVKPTQPSSKPERTSKRFFAEPIQGPGRRITPKRPIPIPTPDSIRAQMKRPKTSLAGRKERPRRPKVGTAGKKKTPSSKSGAGGSQGSTAGPGMKELYRVAVFCPMLSCKPQTKSIYPDTLTYLLRKN